MIFKKNELRLLWPFYIVYLLFGLSAIILPFEIIYFKNLGFDYLQLSIISIASGLGIILFEVPTGVIADIFSRKLSVIIGFFLSGIAVLAIPFVTNFYLIAVLMFIVGIAMSFISGAEESWVMDNLNHYKRKDLYQEFFMKVQIAVALGLVITPIIGALLAQNHSMDLLWLIFGTVFLINGFILAFFAREEYVPKRKSFIEGMKKTFHKSGQGFRYMMHNKVVFLLMVAAVLATFFDIGLSGHQPFLVGMSLPQYALGYVYSVMGFLIIISVFASRLLSRFRVRTVVITITFIRMLLLFSVFFLLYPYYLLAAGIIILYGSIISLQDPILSPYLHRHIKKSIRATVISARSMIITVASVLVQLLGGVLMDIYGPQQVIALGGVLGLFALVTYGKIDD